MAARGATSILFFSYGRLRRAVARQRDQCDGRRNQHHRKRTEHCCPRFHHVAPLRTQPTCEARCRPPAPRHRSPCPSCRRRQAIPQCAECRRASATRMRTNAWSTIGAPCRKNCSALRSRGGHAQSRPCSDRVGRSSPAGRCARRAHNPHGLRLPSCLPGKWRTQDCGGRHGRFPRTEIAGTTAEPASPQRLG